MTTHQFKGVAIATVPNLPTRSLFNFHGCSEFCSLVNTSKGIPELMPLYSSYVTLVRLLIPIGMDTVIARVLENVSVE